MTFIASTKGINRDTFPSVFTCWSDQPKKVKASSACPEAKGKTKRRSKKGLGIRIAGSGECLSSIGLRQDKRWQAIERSADHAVRIAVDVETLVGEKTNQSQAEGVGQLDGQTGWRPHGGQHGNTCHQGFLDEFETGSATH